MYLTQHTDYGFRVLLYAAANREKLVNIAVIAEHYGISKSHLMKVVTSLVKGGFLEGVRGKGGGLRLAREPELINVGAVVRYLEPMKLVECMGAGNGCMIAANCRLAGILGGAGKAFLHHLDGFTLADLLNRPTLETLHFAEMPAQEADTGSEAV
ncbi:MAG: Rrf2 family transcriptional regulator [Neisseria sp.]|nr:Rrf2 family transcriptional regulator [Neisseria sp.]